MNKKGFISISSVYAFFLVFLLLLLFTVNGMVSNRVMINNIKNEVKEEISTSTSIPIIESINYSVTNNSISINVLASTSEGTITKYYYSKDNGVNYVSSSNSNYTFTGLESNKTYFIFIYVENSLNKKSNVSIVKPTTSEYVNPSVSNVTVSNITKNSVTLKIVASKGTSDIKTYYFSKNNGSSYVSSSSNTYTFTGLSYATAYNFKVYVKDTTGASSNTKNVSAKTLNPTLADVCVSGRNLAECIKDFNDLVGDGIDGLYYHDGIGSYTNYDQEAKDYSLRFAGGNVNNYVCFGSTATTCPHDNLYRIIGVFDGKVKLIKYDIAGEDILGAEPRVFIGFDDYPEYKGKASFLSAYPWTGDYNVLNNVWSESILNLNVLNGSYLNILGSYWTNKIATTTWKYGGNYYQSIYSLTVKPAYQNEILYPYVNKTHSAKIGLMYVNDYGYAASPENWKTSLVDYLSDLNKNNNWMFMGIPEWTITNRLNSDASAFTVGDDGSVLHGIIGNSNCVRPVFFLNSNIICTGGAGTINNPYRIS